MPEARTLFIANETESASWMYRVRWPCEFLTSQGFIADWVLDTNFDSMSPAITAGKYNVVVLSRLNWASRSDAERWDTFAHTCGAAWVYAADDDVWGIESLDPLRITKAVADRGPEAIEQDRQNRILTAQLADAVLVTTPLLAERARSITDRPVVTIPPLIDTAWFDGIYNPLREHVTVGWSGTFRPDSDLAGLAEVWTELARTNPEIRFVIQGAEPGTNHVPVLAQSVPRDRLTISEWVPLAAYPARLTDIDIMCCYMPPDSDFARAHSPIKWMEASLAGAACVVSEEVYGEVTEGGNNALVATSRDEWLSAIRDLAGSRSRRVALSGRAAEQVRALHSMEQNWPFWLEGLEEIRLTRAQSNSKRPA